MDKNEKDTFLELYVFENTKLLEQFEQCILAIEQEGFKKEETDEIFRVMHTIKGSSNTMGYENIAKLAHSVEDLLDFIRGNINLKFDKDELYDLMLKAMDVLNEETIKLQDPNYIPADFSELSQKFIDYLAKISNSLINVKSSIQNSHAVDDILLSGKYIKIEYDENEKLHNYYAVINFVDDCEMVHIRAFELFHKIRDKLEIIEHVPFRFDILNEKLIQNKGFQIIFRTSLNKNEVRELIEKSCYFLKNLNLNYIKLTKTRKSSLEEDLKDDSYKSEKKTEIIGVNVTKLDKLMDITSEIIITEAILIQNPDLDGLKLRNFKKVARQFNKITNELQDVVMSIRMVSLVATFNKMKRLTRDVTQKLNKKVKIEIKGEKTEVDKNIIDSITDPLIHIIRNSLDHGIESSEERSKKGKPEYGIIKLEAKNVGGEVWISVEDDGCGLDQEKILHKAIQLGMVNDEAENLSSNEIYSLIFKPGFSTKEKASEYSGRGVGMDIVLKNIERVFGTIDVDSQLDKGTVFTIRIPLTLAIIKGITVCVGESKFTAPVESIEEVLILKNENIVIYPDGSEIIKIRDKFYDLIKLGEKYGINTKYSNLTEGTTILVNARGNKICLFVDKIIGEQQVVVKPLPKYINNVEGIAGCTLLGDGTISLILDLESIAKMASKSSKKLNFVGRA